MNWIASSIGIGLILFLWFLLPGVRWARINRRVGAAYREFGVRENPQW